MPRNFDTKVQTENGEAAVHVNRRGCKGRWTKKDQEMLEAMVRAVHATTPVPSPGDKGSDNG